jgi:hypothetical protein
MTRIVTKQPYTQDYTNIRIDLGGMQGARLAPAAMTVDSLLKLRNRRIFEEMKPLMLSAHSIEEDLYASVSGAGISAVSENMRLLPDAEAFGDPGFTDSQFIHNFVLKEAFYRDQIESSYSGDELKAKLAEFDAISSRVVSALAGRFASGVGAFFNGTQAWLNDGASARDAAQPYFDEKAFKAHVLDIVARSRAALETIKRDNPDEWAELLQTGGANGSFFVQALDAAAASADAGGAAGIERMGYGDIVSVSRAIGAMGKGIYTNSPAMLAAYLGQEKLKSELAAACFPMSESVGRAFLAAVDRNIRIKISSFKAAWGRGLNTSRANAAFGAQFDEMFQAFARLPAGDTDGFRAGYAFALKGLYERLTALPGTPESPKANQLAMAKGCLEMLARGWNEFLDGTGLSESGYAVRGPLGNLVDVAL